MRLLSLLVLLLFAASAHAETITLTTQQARTVFVGLQALAGYEDQTNAKPVLRVYALSPAVRVAIKNDLVALTPVIEAYNKARGEELCSLVPTSCAIAKDDGPNLLAIAKFDEAAGKVKITRDLTRLSVDDLQLDKNDHITGSILAALAPVMAPEVAK